LRHICEVSKLAAVIEASLVPISAAARVLLADNPKLMATVLTGGDDYEILFTAPPDAAKNIAELSRAAGVPITRIGHMQALFDGKPNISVIGPSGSPLVFASEGWTHF
jgi:thiamine-monophosphate kinase